MMLSRLILNPLDRDVRRMLSDAEELHRCLLAAFPAVERPDARASHGVLHRLETDERSGALVLLVQSAATPSWDRWDAQRFAAVDHAVRTRSLGDDLERLGLGARRAFRLRANATRRILTKSTADGTRSNGKRVPVRGEEGALAWLDRKAQDAGFAIVEDDGVRKVVARSEPVTMGRRQGQRLTFEGVRFDGVLVVTDAGRLRSAVVDGVGPAKAYGFGLLSLRDVS